MIAYPFSGLFPRDPRSWIFGHGGDSFAGNPRYLFLWMLLHRPDIRVTWLTGSAATFDLLRRNGLPVRRRWSPGGVAAALRARVFCYSHGVADTNLPLSRGAFLLNTWHGVGLKTTALGYQGGGGEFARRQLTTMWGRLRARVMTPDIVVATSDFMQRHFARQFHIAEPRCPVLGYPRLDGAADPALQARALALDEDAGFRLNPGAYREIYLYVPTYRDTDRPFLEAAFPDLDQLSAVLKARGALLYVKLHPRTAEALPTDHPNIAKWPDEIDFHSYFPDLAGLITDYSSVLYDYIFVRGEGAVLYTFDFDEYIARDRTLLYPFDENVAGLRVNDFAGLCAALEDGRANGPIDEADLTPVRERFWGGSPSPSSPAVVDHVEQYLGQADHASRTQ